MSFKCRKYEIITLKEKHLIRFNLIKIKCYYSYFGYVKQNNMKNIKIHLLIGLNINILLKNQKKIKDE